MKKGEPAMSHTVIFMMAALIPRMTGMTRLLARPTTIRATPRRMAKKIMPRD
jgi:hypothetical protein